MRSERKIEKGLTRKERKERTRKEKRNGEKIRIKNE